MGWFSLNCIEVFDIVMCSKRIWIKICSQRYDGEEQDELCFVFCRTVICLVVFVK